MMKYIKTRAVGSDNVDRILSVMFWSQSQKKWPAVWELRDDLLVQTKLNRRIIMPRGDKSKYTDKQERKADHIAEGYEKRAVPEQEAERRAWATVNKDDGGGKKAGGSGRGKSTGHPAAHKGGEKGGAASASRSAASRSASARKAAATRKRNAEQHP
jgi:plasmid stabilization system protein ParE